MTKNRGRRVSRAIVDEVLRSWIECAGDVGLSEGPGGSRDETLLQVLVEYEEQGLAMRRLDSAGRIRWDATETLVSHLADLEREAEEDLEDIP